MYFKPLTCFHRVAGRGSARLSVQIVYILWVTVHLVYVYGASVRSRRSGKNSAYSKFIYCY